MRIKQLHVRNFRSLEAIDFELSPLTALVGPNNAGKSNILLAIRAVLGRDWVSVGSFSEDDVHLHDVARDIVIRVDLDQPFAHSKFKGTPPANIESLVFEYTRYQRAPRKGERRLEQSCRDGKDAIPSIAQEAFKKGAQPKFGPLLGIPSEVREAIPVIYIGTQRGLRDHLPSARYGLLRPLIDDIDDDLQDTSNTMSVKQADGTVREVPRTARYRRLMEEVVKVLRTPLLMQLETEIKTGALQQLGLDPVRDAAALDLYFGPLASLDVFRTMELQLREGAFALNATELGEGVQNAIVLAILQAFEQRKKKGAVILLEEPEMFLHPQRQRSLYETLRRLSATNQVVYTTHSPHFVTIPEYSEVVVVRRRGAATDVTRSPIPATPQRLEKFRKELDPERNELFFATRLILVEGDTEKLALPEYARRLALDLNRVGVSIVEVGGKRNLPELAALAISFGIPVGILYDKDATDFAADRGAETAFNNQLDGLARADGTVRVWRLDPSYEAVLRAAMGDKAYESACGRHGGTTKPIRARLIAADESTAIPPLVEEALRWAIG